MLHVWPPVRHVRLLVMFAGLCVLLSVFCFVCLLLCLCFVSLLCVLALCFDFNLLTCVVCL